MKVPWSWLRELVPDAPELPVTCDLLSSIGLSVEAVHEAPAAPERVVVARILETRPLPGSDRLVVAVVDDGSGSPREVVCGAPNARPGLVSALALPGASLPPSGPGAGLEVGEREVMGVRSAGMLCSARELGLYDHAGGIVEYPDDLEPGAALAELWPADRVIELELTPNRADAFGVLGVARDLAAKLGAPFRHPAEGAPLGDPAQGDGLEGRVEDPDACPRLTLRRVDGVRVGPSPLWLQRRLGQLGLRPRNNVVDVTNYVTFELGQPSHAYDLRALEGGTMVVRRAEAGERVEVLGGATVELDPADLVIATPDGEGGTSPIGVAGVIGGLHDSVRADTGAVAIEVAHFDPVTVRKTAKRHDLRTDAHHRFERGVDPALPPLASARVCALIQEVAGGTAHPGITDVGAPPARREIAFRPSRVLFLTALEVPLERQRAFLEALGCEVEARGDDDWLVRAPTWRFDLALEEDLIEEVARLHGFEHLPSTVPQMAFAPPKSDPLHLALRRELAAQGFQETIGYVFAGEVELGRAAAPAPRVRLANPQGIERAVLRTALHPGLLQAAAANRARAGVALFEVGRVFGDEERERLGVLVRGAWEEPGWLPGREVDFPLFKGLLERAAAVRGARLELRPADPAAAPHLHPGVAAEALWNGRPVGFAGRVHPDVAATFELEEVYVAELDLPLEGGPARFRDPVRQPYAERDVAVVAPDEATYARVREIVAGAAGERLESLEPFDVYRGAPVPEGHRSLALRLRFRHPERALTDAEVDPAMENVITALRAEGYAIRDR